MAYDLKRKIKAQQIQSCAKNSFGIVLASSSFSLIIRQYLEQLKSLESSIAAFKDPAISLFYQKKRSEGKDHLTAIGHACYKMLSIIFSPAFAIINLIFRLSLLDFL